MGRAFGLILFGILSVLLITVGFTAFPPQTGINLGQVGQGGVGFQETAVADYIVIAGKITDPTNGEWKNNYTVIPYLDGQEISDPQNRAISRTGKYVASGEGVHDGLFVLYIPNRYELTTAHDFVNPNNEVVTMQFSNGGVVGASHLYIWLGEVNPGDTYRLNVPAKQIEYAIAVMREDNANLNPDIHQNNTTLHEDGQVTKQTDVIISSPVENPDSPKQIGWTREYTAPDSTIIWDTWKLYVENQVSGMDWKTYYAEVMQQNPNLAQTGYFVKGQTYHLPVLLEG